jgi:hypothetical protein
MEKRKDPRLPLEYFSVDASDGAGFFQGAVENVSRFGICIKYLAQRLNNKEKEIIIVVAGNGRNFRLKARPRWSTLDSTAKSVGAEIINPPWAWTYFIVSLEPKPDDVWATVRM